MIYETVEKRARDCAMEMAKKSPGGSVSHLEGASCEYGYAHGFMAGLEAAAKAGEHLLESAHAASYKVQDRGTQRFIIAAVNTYKLTMEKIKGQL